VGRAGESSGPGARKQAGGALGLDHDDLRADVTIERFGKCCDRRRHTADAGLHEDVGGRRKRLGAGLLAFGDMVKQLWQDWTVAVASGAKFHGADV
jgi:hypothetical protein